MKYNGGNSRRFLKIVIIVALVAVVTVFPFYLIRLERSRDKQFTQNEYIIERIKSADEHDNDESRSSSDDMNVNSDSEDLIELARKNDIPASYNASIDLPGWKCKELPSPGDAVNKFIFVHVYKTAGGSFREFFLQYGENCGRGVTAINHCSHLSLKSLNEKDPEKPWTPCHHIITLKNNRKVYSQSSEVSRYQIQKYADILTGHLPVGIHKNWVVDSVDYDSVHDVKERVQLPIVPQYMTVFRDPYSKFISGKTWSNRNKYRDEDTMLTYIRGKIEHMFHNGKTYLGYTSYLTTPEQKVNGKEMNFTKGDWINVMKTNILDMNILIGAVEYMGETVELMRSVMDIDREMTPIFRSIVYPDNDGTVHKANISTSRLMKALKNDKQIWNMLTEILKYEFELYDFALTIHKMQLLELRRKYGNLYEIE